MHALLSATRHTHCIYFKLCTCHGHIHGLIHTKYRVAETFHLGDIAIQAQKLLVIL